MINEKNKTFLLLLTISYMVYFSAAEILPKKKMPAPQRRIVQYEFEAADPYREIILAEADRNGLEPELIAAVIIRESEGNPYARGLAGEIGLMQTMPSTVNINANSLFNPRINIYAGSKYLRQMINEKGNAYVGIGAYNSGPNACIQWNYKGQCVVPWVNHKYAGKVMEIKQRLESKKKVIVL